MTRLIEDGDFVYIFLDAKRNWIRRVKAGEAFHSNKGIIQFDDLIGRQFGIRVESHSGTIFQVHRPTQTDIQIAMGRNTQIVYPKDAGIILTSLHEQLEKLDMSTHTRLGKTCTKAQRGI